MHKTESREEKIIPNSEINGVGRYIVDTPGCKIRNLEPLSSSMKMKKFFGYEKLINCSRAANLNVSLTIGNMLHFFPEYIEERHFKRDDIPGLNSSKNPSPIFERMNRSSIICCYEPIERAPDDDNDISFSGQCFPIEKNKTLILNYDVITVYCNKSSTTFYENVHHLMHKKEIADDVKSQAASTSLTGTRFKKPKKSEKLSVIIFGMDSVSRQNFIRTNPKTYKYLTKTLKAFDFKGFNRVGDNTVPNLVPVLMGLSVNELNSPDCIVNTKGRKDIKDKIPKFDGCPFVWNDFKKNGYVTSYIEDAPFIGIFNFLRTGFAKPPTDHYGRPYMLALAEILGWNSRENVQRCAGNKIFIKALQDYSLSFLKCYRNEPTFSLIWATSLTHRTLNSGRIADEVNLEYIKTLKENGALDNTILIFMSDHGLRWVDFRITLLGKYEANLPYLFVVVPESFKKKFKKVNQNLEKNTGKLVTAFDLYATLNDIASSNYKNTTYIETSAPKRARRISLFREIPGERTCTDIGFEYNFCACQQYTLIKNHTSFENIENSLTHYLNEMLKGFPKCSVVEKFHITQAYISTEEGKPFSEKNTTFNVQGTYCPGDALIEFTCVCNSEEKTCQIIGKISRLSDYGNQSHCVEDKELKQFCICKDVV